jgi:hypothetical protein
VTGASDADAPLAPTVILPQPPAADPIVLGGAPSAAEGGLPRTGPAASHAAPVDDDPILLETLTEVPVLTDVVREWPARTGASPRGDDADESAGDSTPVRWAAGHPSGAADRATESGTREDPGDAFPTSAERAEQIAAKLPPPAVLEQQRDAPVSPLESPRDAPEPTPSARGTSRDPRHKVTPAVPLDDEFILEIPPAVEEKRAVAAVESPIPSVPAPALPPPDVETWDALAEELRMQVLQRLDLLADTGLRTQLSARLAPIVERASAQLIETINRELGDLVRGYVAEAIEREIESWRRRSGDSGE